MQSAIRTFNPRLPAIRAQIFIVALLAAVMALTIAVPEQAVNVGPLGVLLGYGATGLTIVRRLPRVDQRERRAWTLVGVGFLVAAFGIAVVGALQATTGSVAAFGPPDALFISSYVLIIGGFVSLPHFPVGFSQRIRIYLDSAIGAVSLAVIMWVLTLDDLMARLESATAWERWAGTAYPIVDVAALMVVVIVAVRRSTFRFDPRLVLFAVGMVLQSIADLRFLTTGIGNTLSEAQPNFAMFLLAAAAYLSAAGIVDRPPKARVYRDRRTPLWAAVTPYSVAVAMVVTLAAHTRDSGMSPHLKVLLAATFFVGALVVVRQSVAIRENRILVEKQRADLVSSISHELRTPLTAVVGFLDVINDDDSPVPDSERRELSKVVQQQARHMSRIVADLILLARGSPDELVLKEEVVAVAQIAAEARRSTAEFDIRVDTEAVRGLEARVDPGRLQQILINLLSNAARYGNGRGLLVLRRDANDLIVEVHDNGPGVPKKYETSIWERFERGVNRFNGSIPGSGIGLAVVAAIATAHGGTTGYRPSELLGGACFQVVLPNRVVAG